MSHPLSPSPSTPVDSPLWDRYREFLKVAGYSVTPLPGHEDSDVDPHVPSAAPDYDPVLDATENREEALHEILMSIYAVGNRLHDVLSSISASEGNWTKTTTGQLLYQSARSLSVAAGALDIALSMERTKK